MQSMQEALLHKVSNGSSGYVNYMPARMIVMEYIAVVYCYNWKLLAYLFIVGFDACASVWQLKIARSMLQCDVCIEAHNEGSYDWHENLNSIMG